MEKIENRWNVLNPSLDNLFNCFPVPSPVVNSVDEWSGRDLGIACTENYAFLIISPILLLWDSEIRELVALIICQFFRICFLELLTEISWDTETVSKAAYHFTRWISTLQQHINFSDFILNKWFCIHSCSVACKCHLVPCCA